MGLFLCSDHFTEQRERKRDRGREIETDRQGKIGRESERDREG